MSETKKELLERVRNLEKEINILIKENSKLKIIAYKDELTDAYNRRATGSFGDQLLNEVKDERRKDNEDQLSVIIFDIDYFKKFNDNYGHEAGDEVLKNVSKKVSSLLRQSDIFGRWGGEEFIILIKADENGASVVSEKIRKGIENLNIQYLNEKLNVTASFGVSSYDNENNFSELVKAADEALYNAKESGRNKVVKRSEIK